MHVKSKTSTATMMGLMVARNLSFCVHHMSCYVIIQICLIILCLTSCARGNTICLCPLHVDNIFIFIRQVAVLFRHVGYLRHQLQVYLWPLDLESGVWVTYDVSYLYLFSLLRPLCSRVRPDVCNRRQTKASLSASALWGGVIIIGLCFMWPLLCWCVV